MKILTLALLLGVGLAVSPALGQQSLTTTYAGGNSSAGNMFDVKALNDITITGFDINFASGTDQFEVWYRPGSYLPYLGTSDGWNLAGVTGPVTSNGAGIPTPLPLTTCITIPAGQTYGIYIHRQSGSLTCTNGVAQGALFVADANLEIYEGHGGSYFNMVNVPRVWNGTIHYSAPPVFGAWNTNSAQMSLAIDGAGGPPCFAAIVSKDIVSCNPIVPATGTLSITSTEIGAIYDVLLSFQPAVPAFGGGIILSDGQIVNVDAFSPFVWLSTGTSAGAITTLPSYFPGATQTSINLGFSISSATSLSMQGVVISAASPLGFVLSQATELHISVVPPAASIPGPTTVSGLTTVDVTAAPTCWAPGGIPFYGGVFNTMTVFGGGVIQFGGTDTDTSPSILDAIGDDGRVGFWTGLDPSEGGSISISSPAPNIVRADWNGVWYDAGGPGVTFGIQIDCLTGVITIDGLGGLVPNPLTTSTLDDQWLGISPGITFAPAVTTDPGAAGFGFGLNGLAAVETDMLYEFNDISVSLNGLPPSVAGGMTILMFTPITVGMGTNYQWSGT